MPRVYELDRHFAKRNVLICWSMTVLQSRGPEQIPKKEQRLENVSRTYCTFCPVMKIYTHTKQVFNVSVPPLKKELATLFGPYRKNPSYREEACHSTSAGQRQTSYLQLQQRYRLGKQVGYLHR